MDIFLFVNNSLRLNTLHVIHCQSPMHIVTYGLPHPYCADNDVGRSTFNMRTVRASFSYAYTVLSSALLNTSAIRCDDMSEAW